MVHPGEEPTDSHSHDTHSCDTIADKRLQYIQSHLEQVKAECAGYQACVTSIMSQNSALTLIEGGDLEIRTVCRSLIPRDDDGNPLIGRRRWRGRYRRVRNSTSENPQVVSMEEEEENASCPRAARITIRRDINSHLTEAVELRDHHPEWQKVYDCLEGAEEEEGEASDPYFLRACRMAFTNRTVCNRTVKKTLENFFTRQLEHLQCVCQALPGAAPAPVGLIAGLSVGGAVLLLLLLFLLIYCCYFRPKQRKRKGMKRNEQSWDSWGPPIYIAGASDRQDSVYSEIDEGSVGRGRVLLGGKGRSSHPPRLPERYTEDPTRQPPVGADGYLEPGASSGSGVNLSSSSRANISGSSEADYLLEKPVSSECRGGPDDDEYLDLLPDSPPPPPPSMRQGDGGEGKEGEYFTLERDSKSGLPIMLPAEGNQQEQQNDDKEKETQQQEKQEKEQPQKQQEQENQTEQEKLPEQVKEQDQEKQQQGEDKQQEQEQKQPQQKQPEQQ